MGRTRPLTGPDDPRHGTVAGYQQEYKVGGRAAVCARCLDAERRYQNRMSRMQAYGQPRKVPAIGSVRRLRALMATGWSGEYLADRLGLRRGNLPTNTKYDTVRIATHDKVKALYDELVVRDGPSPRTRSRAEKAGWATPDQWLGRDMDDPAVHPASAEEVDARVDDVAVERAVTALQQQRERVDLTWDEKVALVRRAEALGVSHNATQKYLKIGGSAFTELLRVAHEETA